MLYTWLGAVLLGRISCSPVTVSGSSALGSQDTVTGSQTTNAPACYKTKSGECGDPLTQSDCGEGEWLLLGEAGVLECREKYCQPEQVLIDGKCFAIDDISICPGSGEEISVNAKGEASCQCKDGWSRRTGSNNSPVWATMMSQGECYQEITDSDYNDFEYDDDDDVVGRVPRSTEFGTDYTDDDCARTGTCDTCNKTWIKKNSCVKMRRKRTCEEFKQKMEDKKCITMCKPKTFFGRK